MSQTRQGDFSTGIEAALAVGHFAGRWNLLAWRHDTIFPKSYAKRITKAVQWVAKQPTAAENRRTTNSSQIFRDQTKAHNEVVRVMGLIPYSKCRTVLGSHLAQVVKPHRRNIRMAKPLCRFTFGEVGFI
jgi:hypothetical protein